MYKRQHLTSVVKGQLLPELTALDALKSTLPAGTVSGAPKIRAMRRIYELEQEKRGIYAGAIGYLSATGDMDFAIAIDVYKRQTKSCADFPVKVVAANSAWLFSICF